VSLRLRHVYFDDDGTARPLSQARFERVFGLHMREPIPELAGRRVRFLTLFVWFEDGIPIEVSQTDASLVTFDDEGRRDLTEANRERHAAVGLLDQSDQPSTTGVVSAAARFQTAGFRWTPTRAEIEAAIAVHGLRNDPT